MVANTFRILQSLTSVVSSAVMLILEDLSQCSVMKLKEARYIKLAKGRQLGQVTSLLTVLLQERT